MASLPSGATETVCVLGKEQKVVPVAKCGMPCCAKLTAKPAPLGKKDCCSPGKVRATTTPSAAHSLCRSSGMDCRCETRLIAAPVGNAAVENKAKLVEPVEQPALLPTVQAEVPSPTLLAFEPGIVGVDSGPPRKLPRSPSRSRAPPVSV